MMRYLGSLSLHVIFVIISSELFKKPCRSLVQRITIVEFFHRYYLLVHPDHRILLSRVAATMVRGGGECRFDGLAWVVDGVVEVEAKFSCCGFQNGEGEKRGGKKRRKKEDRPTMTRLITVSRSPDDHEERQYL